jgi:hypothetical protein
MGPQASWRPLLRTIRVVPGLQRAEGSGPKLRLAGRFIGLAENLLGLLDGLLGDPQSLLGNLQPLLSRPLSRP